MRKVLSLLFLMCAVFFVVGCQQEGKPEKHEDHGTMQIWQNANCQSPKKCLLCGYTEGELGDHSTKVGTCRHCNEFQNEELFENIKTELSGLVENLNGAYNFLVEKEDEPMISEEMLGIAVQVVDPTFEKEKGKLENIIELCGDFEELSDIKKNAEKALENYPVKPEGKTFNDYREYISSVTFCYGYILEAANDTRFIS